jgi:hypothetical protein
MKAAKVQTQLRAKRLRRVRHIRRRAPARHQKPADMWETIT